MAEVVGSVEVEVTADTDPAVRETKATAARLSKTVEIKLKVDVDTKSATRNMARLGRSSRSTLAPLKSLVNTVGNVALSFITLGRSLRPQTAGLLSLTPIVLGLGNVIGGLAASVIALAGSLVHASASLVNVGVLGGALAQAFGVGLIASRGLTDAFKAQSKAQEELARTGEVSEATQQELARSMKELTPAARGLVRAVQDVRGQWGQFQNLLQQNLFQGFGNELRRITEALLPTLRRNLGETANILNRFALGWSKSIRSAEGIQRVNRITRALNGILLALLPAIAPLADAFSTIFLGAAPGAKGLADAITRIANQFNRFIQSKAKSGELTAFFEEAGRLAGQVFRILGNLGDALFTVFEAGSKQGAGLLDFFEQATADLSAFLKSAEGQDALEGLFAMIATIGPTVQTAMAILGPVFTGLFTAFQEIGPAMDTARTALIPALTEIGVALGDAFVQAAPYIADLIVALAPLIAQIVEELVPVLPVLTEYMVALLGVITPLAQVLSILLVPAMELLGPPLRFVMTSFAVLMALGLGTLIKEFHRLAPAAEAVGKAMLAVGRFLRNLQQIAGRVAGAIGRAISTMVSVVSSKLEAVGGFIRHAGQVFGSLPGLIRGALTRAISAVSTFVSRGIAKFNEFRKRVSSVVSDIVGFFDKLGGKIMGALSSIGSSVWSGLQSTLNAGIDIMNRGISGFNKLPGPDISTIPHVASGAIFTSPTLAVIGEGRGPEVAAPMNPRQPMAPGVLEAVQKIARDRGSGAGNNVEMTVMLPTGDPQAAALAVMNRLVAAGIG